MVIWNGSFVHVQRQYKLRSTTKFFTVPGIQSLTMEEHISLRRRSSLLRLNEDGSFHDFVHVCSLCWPAGHGQQQTDSLLIVFQGFML